MKKLLKKIIVAILSWQARQVLVRARPHIVAVTGSVGKTSTKDAIAAVLARAGTVRKSEKSYNSELGVPLTILGLDTAWESPVGWFFNLLRGMQIALNPGAYPEWLVLEVGADHPGDIGRICEWMKPDIAVLTRVGEMPVHVEQFLSPAHLFEEKAKLAHAVKEEGVAVLCSDDERIRTLGQKLRVRTITYGYGEEARIRGSHAQILYDGNVPVGVTIKINIGGKSMPLRLRNVFGAHAASSALAALAVAEVVKVNVLDAISALEMLQPAPGRLRFIAGINNSTILDDTYNSSPVALHAALETLQEIKTPGRKIAVLGDMLELGVYSEEEHKKAGRHVATVCEYLFAVGSFARVYEEGARQGGMKQDKIKCFDDARTAGSALERIVESHDVILIKGSQSLRMERAVMEVMREPEHAPELLVRQDPEWQRR